MVSKKVTNIGIGVVIIAIAIAAAIYLIYPESDEIPLPEPPPIPIPIPLPEALPSIGVSDQPVRNGTIVIDTLFLDKPGYVVMHKVNEEGKPGMVIGHTGLLEGLNMQVPVSITDYLGETELIAMLHYDDGDGNYQFPGADAPTVLDERIVLTKFRIS
ncbi:MAG: hypothetical protein ACE5KG_02630 [Nitrososphaerales archaeon]